jgi:hypothetical protein
MVRVPLLEKEKMSPGIAARHNTGACSMRKFILPAVLAAALGFAFLPSQAKAGGFSLSINPGGVYYGPAYGYGYSNYYAPPVYYTPSYYYGGASYYPYGYSNYGYSPYRNHEWREHEEHERHEWNEHHDHGDWDHHRH